MKPLKRDELIGVFDLGSSYTKILIGDLKGNIFHKILLPSFEKIEKYIKIKNLKYFASTGHLKNLIETNYQYPEAKALHSSICTLKEKKGTLIDIGGQDLKILIFEDGKILSTKINRRCASGTGSFLDFISFKLNLKKEDLNKLAKKTKDFYPLNSYCTVFSSFEIIEMLNKKIKIETIARSLFYSMALRIYEMGPFEEPIILTGGVVQNFPIFYDIFSEVLKLKIKKIKDPQFFQAKGAYLLLLKDLREILDYFTLS